MRRMGGGPTQALSFGRSKAKIYDRKELKTTFADVAGVDEAKAELMEVVDFLKNPKKYQRLGGRIPKGVLLVGPPGTGKTLLARAVAGEADVPFFFLSGSEFVEMFVGVGASRVRDLFEQAKEKAPCIVFIDELDAIGKTRAGATGFAGGHDEREQTLNQLLAEMDGFDSSKGVIIMAATNRPEVLDAALLRAGRFDRQVVVDKPDVRGREAILQVHARNVILAPSVDLHVLAARTPGMAGADLANIVNEAALLAARKGKDAVDMADLDEAVDRVIGGLERKSRVLSEKERDIVAHHEIGHALVASSLPQADPVHKVTIIPRGVGRSRRHLPAAARGPLPPDAERAGRPDRGAPGRPGGRGSRLRRDLDGRPQRPRARDRDGAAHGHPVRHVGRARPDDLRRRAAGPLPQGLGHLAGARVQRRDGAGHRRRDPRHHRQDLRPRARPHHGPQARAADCGRGTQGEGDPRRRPPAAAAGRRPRGGETMILVKRGTLVVMLVIAAALGVGLGSWGASALDLSKPVAQRRRPQRRRLQADRCTAAVQAPVVPAALPVASGSFAQVAEAVGPAVVNINTIIRSGGGGRPSRSSSATSSSAASSASPERPQQQRSLGSGVIVDPSGIALTNAHVVERATEIEVVTADGKKHKAKIDRRSTSAPTSPC